MIPALREAFNHNFRPEAYQQFLRDLEAAAGTPIAFRVSETPCFFPKALLDQMAEDGRELVLQLVNNPNVNEALSVTKTDAGLWILGNMNNSYSGVTTIKSSVSSLLSEVPRNGTPRTGTSQMYGNPDFCVVVISWTSRMQPSKSVSRYSTSEPLETGWMSCAREIFPRGNSTIDGMPAAAQ